MADNLVIESPDFDKIRKEAGYATEDAVKLLWYALNNESSLRRQGVRNASEVLEGKVKSAAPSANQDNYDDERCLVLLFTGSTSFNLTGIRNGIEGRVIFIHNIGTGTVTLKHNTTSDTANRLNLDTGADKSLVTNSSIIFLYVNGVWKELNLL